MLRYSIAHYLDLLKRIYNKIFKEMKMRQIRIAKNLHIKIRNSRLQDMDLSAIDLHLIAFL